MSEDMACLISDRNRQAGEQMQAYSMSIISQACLSCEGHVSIGPSDVAAQSDSLIQVMWSDVLRPLGGHISPKRLLLD